MTLDILEEDDNYIAREKLRRLQIFSELNN
jgi:hypothetical protein